MCAATTKLKRNAADGLFTKPSFFGFTPLTKGGPGRGVAGFAVTFIEGGGICNGPLPWAAGEGVIRDRPGDRSRFHVFDFVPFRARETDPREALAARGNDPAVLVVPGIVLKRIDSQALFDPLEKEFDLPAAFVKLGYDEGSSIHGFLKMILCGLTMFHVMLGKYRHLFLSMGEVRNHCSRW